MQYAYFSGLLYVDQRESNLKLFFQRDLFYLLFRLSRSISSLKGLTPFS